MREWSARPARAAVWWAALGLVLFPSGAVADVADYLGQTVASVRLTIEGRATLDNRLLRIVETRVGRPLSMRDVRESLTHLYSLGRFERAAARAEMGDGGVALVYELVPTHPIERIRFSGRLQAPDIDENRLRAVIADRYGASPPPGRTADMAALLQERLRELGYLRAHVEGRIEVAHAPDRAVLVFTVEPGARASIGRIDVTGDPGMPAAQLLQRLGLAAGVPYRREALDVRAERYLRERRSRGYYNARLTLVPQLADDGRVVDIAVNAVQGLRVRVAFRGDPLPANRRDDLVPVEREGSTDQDLLEDSTNNIESYLRSLGYRDATAPFTREEQDGELLVTFSVTRGPVYRVARVEITGNTAIPLTALQPSLQLREGRPFSTALLEADADAIENLYRRQGYGQAAVRTDVQIGGDRTGAASVPVNVRIAIDENVRTIVGSVRLRGNETVADDVLLAGLGLRPGADFHLTQMAIDRDAIQAQYGNLGFLTATIDGNPGLSADGARADVVFTVREGPRLYVDHILIVGNERTRTDTIERELQLRSGDPLGLSAVTESQRRLAALGLFRRARISQLGHGDETTRDLLVTVEEAPATTISSWRHGRSSRSAGGTCSARTAR
jgi:outer membrane protein assembly factor BamA